MSAEEGEVSDGQIHSDGGLVRFLWAARRRHARQLNYVCSIHSHKIADMVVL